MKYYTSQQKDNLVYVQAPKVLLYGGGYKDMMPQAKLLYIALIDKLQLSMMNDWKDENDRYYVIMSIENGSELLGFSHSTFRRCKTELIKLELIEEKRMGLNKPNRIYVGRLNYDENDTFDPSKTRNAQIEQSGMSNESTHDCQIRAANNNKSNKNEINNNEYKNNYLEEEKIEIKPTRIKFQSEFSNDEITQAHVFIAPQMYETFDEVTFNDDFKNRFVCYMKMAGMKYVSPKEIRMKNIEIEKEGKQIIDRAFYLVKGIAMKRQAVDSDRLEYNLERARRKEQQRKEFEEERKKYGQPNNIVFYNWLEDAE